jgi:hypothetical protein
MAQVNDWSLDNLPGISFRAQANGVISALQSSNSGATAPSPTVAGMLWFDTGVSPVVPRQRNAANTAWNRIIDTADIAASRSALGAMAQPQTAAGLGQVTPVYADQNTNFVAPSGGTWWGRWQRRNKTSLVNNGQGAGIYSGGAVILAVQNNEDCFGDFIRIA